MPAGAHQRLSLFLTSNPTLPMKIYMPPVFHKTKIHGNTSIKCLQRIEVIDNQLSKELIGGDEAFTFRHNGNDYLLISTNVKKSIATKFRYVLRFENLNIDTESDVLDISEAEWQIHPTLSTNVLRQFTKGYVLKSWQDNFFIKSEQIDGKGLRIPQVGSLYAIQAHWTISNENAIVVLPTGTGKTDTMVAAMVMSKTPALLVVVPTDA
jgi:hypothetical protein